jgi:hypothetical protein
MVGKSSKRTLSRHDNPEQSKRFIEIAKEIGADESQEQLELLLKKAKRPKLHLPLPKEN